MEKPTAYLGKRTCSYIAFFYFTWALKPHSPSHTKNTFLLCLTFTHIHTPLNATESILGFGIMPKDTLACRLKQPATFQLLDYVH